MQTRTVQQMIDDVRSRSDQQNTTFISDNEITTWLDAGYRELYDAIISTYETYYYSTASIPTVGGTDLYTIPTDFYKLLGLDVSIDANRKFTLQPYNFNERNRYITVYPVFPYIFRYAVIGQKLRISPMPNGVYNLTLWYIPAPLKLVNTAPGAGETNSIDAINGFDNYVVLNACKNCMIKEESDPSMYILQQDAALKRILSILQGRDSGFPPRVQDTGRINNPFSMWW